MAVASGALDVIATDGDEDDALDSLYMPTMQPQGYRERSANIWADPKMRELVHYTKSHRHDRRLRENAELEERKKSCEGLPRKGSGAFLTDVPGTSSSKGNSEKDMLSLLRADGCKRVDRQMKRLAGDKPTLPTNGSGSHSELPERIRSGRPGAASLGSMGPGSWASEAEALAARQGQLRRMDSFSTRLGWRDQMDSCMRRLIVDFDLSQDQRLKDYSYKARCDHLDKVHEWYTAHGMKEARKEFPGPPYMRFHVDEPVMPGSLRVEKETRKKAQATALGKSLSAAGGGLVQSVSQPTLTALGTLSLDSVAGDGAASP